MILLVMSSSVGQLHLLAMLPLSSGKEFVPVSPVFPFQFLATLDTGQEANTFCMHRRIEGKTLEDLNERCKMMDEHTSTIV